jgi:hypothetical protein
VFLLSTFELFGPSLDKGPDFFRHFKTPSSAALLKRLCNRTGRRNANRISFSISLGLIAAFAKRIGRHGEVATQAVTRAFDTAAGCFSRE